MFIYALNTRTHNVELIFMLVGWFFFKFLYAIDFNVLCRFFEYLFNLMKYILHGNGRELYYFGW